jgi:hypothetical protein
VNGVAHAEGGRLLETKAHGVLASHRGPHAVGIDLSEVRQRRVANREQGAQQRKHVRACE